MRHRWVRGALSLILTAPTGICAGAVGAGLYAALHRAAVPIGAGVLTVVAPVLGGLLVALFQRLAPEICDTGVRQAGAAVGPLDTVAPRGPVRGRVALLHPLTAAVLAASGWSAGREGPAVFAGAAVGEAAWTRLRGLLRRWADPSPGETEALRRRLLAAGAAGGVAGAVNAPLTAFLLVTVLLLPRGARPAPIVGTGLGAGGGALAHHLVVGPAPLVPHPVPVPPPALLVVVTAVLAVPVAAALTASLRALPRIVDRFWRGPDLLRPVAGGVVIGVLLLAEPRWAGTGVHLLRPDGGPPELPAVLAVLVVGKIATTAITVATGRSGGVIGPVLFLGAAAGQLVAATAQAADPQLADHLGSCWVVGLAAVFGAASRFPLTAAASALELTGSWSLALPVLVAAVLGACGAAAARARALFPRDRPLRPEHPLR